MFSSKRLSPSCFTAAALMEGLWWCTLSTSVPPFRPRPSPRSWCLDWGKAKEMKQWSQSASEEILALVFLLLGLCSPFSPAPSSSMWGRDAYASSRALSTSVGYLDTHTWLNQWYICRYTLILYMYMYMYIHCIRESIVMFSLVTWTKTKAAFNLYFTYFASSDWAKGLMADLTASFLSLSSNFNPRDSYTVENFSSTSLWTTTKC